MQTITRPHSDEVFPFRASLVTAATRNTFQGVQLTCTHVGGTTAVELMDPDGNNYSPRFVWYFRVLGSINIDGFIRNINRVGVCLEELCPYIVDSNFNAVDLDVPPSYEALMDAGQRNVKGFATEYVTDHWGFMRAICNNSSLVLNKVISPGTEHVFAGSGYDFVQGMEVLDNGYENLTEFYPWSSFGLVITQAHRFTKSPFPFTPHPDYKPPSPAVFENGVLTCPFVHVVDADWQKPRKYFKNVKVHFTGEIGPENLIVNDPNMATMDILWRARGPGIADDRLELPFVKIGETVYTNVSVNGVPIVLHSFEED